MLTIHDHPLCSSSRYGLGLLFQSLSVCVCMFFFFAWPQNKWSKAPVFTVRSCLTATPAKATVKSATVTRIACTTGVRQKGDGVGGMVTVPWSDSLGNSSGSRNSSVQALYTKLLMGAAVPQQFVSTVMFNLWLCLDPGWFEAIHNHN